MDGSKSVQALEHFKLLQWSSTGRSQVVVSTNSIHIGLYVVLFRKEGSFVLIKSGLNAQMQQLMNGDKVVR